MIATKAINSVKIKQMLFLVIFVPICLLVLPYAGMQISNFLSSFFSTIFSNLRLGFLLSVFIAIFSVTISISYFEFVCFRIHKLLFVLAAALPTVLFFSISHMWALANNREWSILIQYVLVFASAIYLGFVAIMLSKSRLVKQD